MLPYKITKIQQFRDVGKFKRVDVAQSCKLKMSAYSNLQWLIVFPNERVFHVSGIPNNQNIRIRETENPREIQEHERNSKKVTVWCAIHSEWVLDLYHLENRTV